MKINYVYINMYNKKLQISYLPASNSAICIKGENNPRFIKI